jgi:hypothetical protein
MGLMGPWVISIDPQIQGPSPRTHSAVYLEGCHNIKGTSHREPPIKAIEFIFALSVFYRTNERNGRVL